MMHDWAEIVEDNAGGRYVVTDSEGWYDLQALSPDEQGAAMVCAVTDPDALRGNASGLTHFTDDADCPCACDHLTLANLRGTLDHPETRRIARWPEGRER